MTKSRIIIGIAGGIAAYKTATVVSRLIQAGHHVDVVLTQGAQHFIGQATFAALCGSPPVTDMFDARYPLGPHIELADNADILVIAPATARIIASCAHGLADDLLATLYLNCQCKTIMVPAMSTPMWEKAVVRRNIELLRADGVQILGPGEGWLSCRKEGAGRMAEAEEILSALASHLDFKS